MSTTISNFDRYNVVKENVMSVTLAAESNPGVPDFLSLSYA